MPGDVELSQLQLQFLIQTLQQSINQSVTSQTQAINQSIHSQLNSEEYYSRLIELVEKITSVNTQMVQNQKDLKDLIEEQVLPAFECVKFSESDLVKKTCEDAQLLMHGEKFKFMDMMQDLQESGITAWIKRIVITIGVLATLGVLDLGPKVYSFIKGFFN